MDEVDLFKLQLKLEKISGELRHLYKNIIIWKNPEGIDLVELANGLLSPQIVKLEEIIRELHTEYKDN